MLYQFCVDLFMNVKNDDGDEDEDNDEDYNDNDNDRDYNERVHLID